MELSTRQSLKDARLARASRFLILPRSPFRISWEFVQVFLVLYNAFALPFVVCFRVKQPPGFDILDQTIDAFFYVDLIMNFFTTYEEKGHLVLNNKQVAWHYLTHWFVIDLLGTFPFEVFSSGDVDSGRTLQLTLLRGIKCLRLLRLARLFKFLEKIEFVNHFLKLLRLFFGFSVIAHWLACLWYLIGDIGLDFGSNSTPEGWMVYYNNTGWDVRQKTHMSAYVTSLYWTITTLLTVGYGDITAHTNTEKLFAILTIVFGALISATIFGNVTMLIESLGRSEASYREKMESVKYYMLDLDLPVDLQNRVRQFYTLLWNRNKSFGSEQVLAELPASFHHEIAGFLNQDLFDKSLIFMDSDPVFLRNLAARLKFCVSLPHDDIIHEGEPTDKLYFIRKGSCSISNEKHGKLTVMKEGNYFGEIGMLSSEFGEEFGLGDIAASSVDLLTSTSPSNAATTSTAKNKRTASVTALVNCDLYFLTSEDFASLLQHYPQYHRLFLLIAMCRYKQVDYHDDEDILQKVFIIQVKRKELRLKYHKKDKPKKNSGSGPGGKDDPSNKRGPRKSQANFTPITEPVVDDETSHYVSEQGELFEESTRDLIRRCSLIGLDPIAAQALRQKHETMIGRSPTPTMTPTFASKFDLGGAPTEINLTDAPADSNTTLVQRIPPRVDTASPSSLASPSASSSSILSSIASPSGLIPATSSSSPKRSGRTIRGQSNSGFDLLPEVEEEEEEGGASKLNNSANNLSNSAITPVLPLSSRTIKPISPATPNSITVVASSTSSAAPKVEMEEIRATPRDIIPQVTREPRRVPISSTAATSPLLPNSSPSPRWPPSITATPRQVTSTQALPSTPTSSSFATSGAISNRVPPLAANVTHDHVPSPIGSPSDDPMPTPVPYPFASDTSSPLSPPVVASSTQPQRRASVAAHVANDPAFAAVLARSSALTNSRPLQQFLTSFKRPPSTSPKITPTGTANLNLSSRPTPIPMRYPFPPAAVTSSAPRHPSSSSSTSPPAESRSLIRSEGHQSRSSGSTATSASSSSSDPSAGGVGSEGRGSHSSILDAIEGKEESESGGEAEDDSGESEPTPPLAPYTPAIYQGLGGPNTLPSGGSSISPTSSTSNINRPTSSWTSSVHHPFPRNPTTTAADRPSTIPRPTELRPTFSSSTSPPPIPSYSPLLPSVTTSLPLSIRSPLLPISRLSTHRTNQLAPATIRTNEKKEDNAETGVNSTPSSTITHHE